MTTVADLKQPEDTLEILHELGKLAVCMNSLEKAIVRGDTALMWKLEKESDDLVQTIFELREKTLKPYPATQPSELSPVEAQSIIASDLDKVIGDWNAYLSSDAPK